MPFSVVIPVYNEEKIIEGNTKRLARFLDKLKEPYEIIIADNGSDDRTAEKAKKLEKALSKNSRRVKYIYTRKKGAVGWAFRRAVLSSRYDNIISLDMDLSIDLNFVPECLRLLDDNSIVVGSKLTGSQSRTLLRRFASFGFINLTRVLLSLRFKDYSMAAKGYRKKDIMSGLREIDKGSSYVIELIYSAKKKNLRMKEIPVNCLDKRKGKFTFIDEVVYRFRSLLIFWFRNVIK